jgi:hypothetical protein
MAMIRATITEIEEGLAHRLAIDELNAAFAYCLDHQEYDGLRDLFSTDARYTSGGRALEGAGTIAQFFLQRAAISGPRTTRHMSSGMRMAFTSATSARGSSVWISYACNTEAPVEGITAYLIADFEDVYSFEADGRWRIRERLIRPVFRDPAGAPRP